MEPKAVASRPSRRRIVGGSGCEDDRSGTVGRVESGRLSTLGRCYREAQSIGEAGVSVRVLGVVAGLCAVLAVAGCSESVSGQPEVSGAPLTKEQLLRSLYVAGECDRFDGCGSGHEGFESVRYTEGGVHRLRMGCRQHGWPMGPLHLDQLQFEVSGRFPD